MVADGWLDTADRTIAQRELSGAPGFGCADIPSFRVQSGTGLERELTVGPGGAWCVSGHSQVGSNSCIGRARRSGGLTSFAVLAPWLCPNPHVASASTRISPLPTCVVVVRPTPFLGKGRSGECGRPGLSRRAASTGAGCKMAFGVSRRTWCGRSFLVGCPAELAATGLPGAGRRSSTGGRRSAGPGWSGSGLVAGVVEGAQRVVAAPRQLAGDGDEGDVRVEALAELAVVGVVR